MAKNPPKGYHTITPAIVVRDAGKAIDFYKEAFGAEEVDRMEGPDGSIMHAEIRIGDSLVMLGEENPLEVDDRRTPAEVAVLHQQVVALQARKVGKVGVYLAAFDEVVDLFHAAAADPMLRSVPSSVSRPVRARASR